jgi:16S rRNA (guanine527-N7)-methyltransferase
MSVAIHSVPANELERGCEQLGFQLAAPSLQQLDDYLDLIVKWNAVHNLTAIREKPKMVTHHVLDSLAVAPHLAPNSSVLDVGSGAGLPGIPLAIARPDLRVTLLDSNRKKAAFLQQAIATLKLTNVAIAAERVEAFVAPHAFDVVISRAFSDLAEFAASSACHLAPNGVLFAMKGVHPHEELARLPANFLLKEVVTLTVPGLDAQRRLVVLARP